MSLSPIISGLNLLICSLLHCGPCNNFCYLGDTKNPDDDDDKNKQLCCAKVTHKMAAMKNWRNESFQ